MRFVDLFAGLGGFHLALKQLGHTCVFASEIDPVLQDVYEANRPGRFPATRKRSCAEHRCLELHGGLPEVHQQIPGED
jgi:site-specific DNA-cytosine methylase